MKSLVTICSVQGTGLRHSAQRCGWPWPGLCVAARPLATAKAKGLACHGGSWLLVNHFRLLSTHRVMHRTSMQAALSFHRTEPSSPVTNKGLEHRPEPQSEAGFWAGFMLHDVSRQTIRG